jgi:penicillin-binding protein 2
VNLKKIYTFYFILALSGLFFIIRLFYLQIYSHKYTLNAYNSSIEQEILIPERGIIFDRKGKLLVSNQYFYDLMITPIDIGELENFDIEGFCRLVEISYKDFYEKIEKAKSYSYYSPSVFLSSLSKEKAALIQEKIFIYRGFDLTRRYLRDYKVNKGLHVLGFIGEVSSDEINKNPGIYQMGDFVGKAAIEKTYEEQLKGSKGIKYWIRDRMGRSIEPYNKGKNNQKSISGKELTLTIDWDLQEYAYNLMYKKKGGIIAINPKNGEILTLVSSPSIDPSLFVGKNRSENYLHLAKDPNNPLFNRVTQGLYPPASSFKLLTGFVGLEFGVIDPQTKFICTGEFKYGNRKIRCGCGAYGAYRNLESAIATSCNTYFANVYKKSLEKYEYSYDGLNNWALIAKSFGFGSFLNQDLTGESLGRVPTSKFYDRIYGQKRWNALTTISNSIGQGEVSATPLQLANMMAIIANGGFYHSPHLIKSIEGKTLYFKNPNYVKINSSYFAPIIKGMQGVFSYGTARYLNSMQIAMAGKSGTAQNFIRVKNKSLALKPHSVFTLFAPIENPQIAIAVIIENGGSGSLWAGPIASLIAEKYIKGEVGRKVLEDRILNTGLEKTYDYILRLKNDLGKNVSTK